MHSTPHEPAPCRSARYRAASSALTLVTTVALATTFVLTACAPAAPPVEPYEIDQANVERVINVLAADDMEGRATFSPALWRAAEYIADEYEVIGLEQYAGSEDFMQRMNVAQRSTEACELTLDGAAVPAENVACRLGADAVSLTIDDVEVFTVEGDPMQAFRRAFGATGHMVILMGPDNEEAFRRFSGYLARPGGTLELGEEGGEGSGAPSLVMALVESTATPTSLSVTGAASAEKLPLANVIGQITGNRTDEYVIFSAHYDHVGVREGMEGDNIFNGANDDASGVTAVIELARYFKTRPKPERTLLFVSFTAEESGGYGSRYFAANVDPEQVVAMFNIEMIGKPAAAGPGSTWVTGFDESTFGEILNQAVEGTPYEYTPDPYPDQNLFFRSDNAALARLGVPAHSLSSTPMNEDPDYYRPSDEVETLDLENMTELIRAMALAAAPIISGEATPTRVEIEEGR